MGGRRAKAEMRHRRGLLTAAVVLVTCVTPAAARASGPSGALWSSGGHDLGNTRHADTEVKIGPANVAGLAPKWVFDTGGDVSATPSVDGVNVYVPDWTGHLSAIDRQTGEQVWRRSISDYTGIPGSVSRVTPAIAGDTLVLGDQGGRLGVGARMMAVDRTTGDPIWTTLVETHPAGVITQSPVVFGDRVYVGVSSVEEAYASLVPGWVCCSFRGSVLALDLGTGQILWRTFTAPEGYSGNAVWGSTPVIDPKRHTVYVTTGNNYTVPDDVLACVDANEGDPDAVGGCIAPDDHFDSVVALDMTTGAVKWATRALPYDAWSQACLFGPEENCASPTGPDLDFGEGASLFTAGKGSARIELLGAGQKSGQYWALDPATGRVVWVTQTGPGGITGGLIWGSAVDGARVYVANANSEREPWPIANGTASVNGGFWSALDARTGKILWETPNPTGASAMGPVTVANGVVYGCSLDPDGYMYAMDARSGAVLWSHPSGGSCNAGAAIAGGTVYWGSGYLSPFLPGTTGSDRLYAFAVPD